MTRQVMFESGGDGVMIRWLLKGDCGVVQFIIPTGWCAPNWADQVRLQYPYEVGYHSPKPLYEDQPLIAEECEYLDGAPCYYDGSSLLGREAFNLLVNEGEEAVWKYLEDYYDSTFN